MTDALAAFLGWLVPAVVVFGVAALATGVTVWAVRRARRSPGARSRAEAARIEAGSVLVRLDDAVAELDLEVSLSDALYGGTAPAELRRARMTAQHARDRSFAEYGALTDDPPPPAEAVQRARSVTRHAEEALAVVERARSDYGVWLRTQEAAGTQVDALRARATSLQAAIGDPDALVAELRERYDEPEWRPAADAADRALVALRTATARLDAADAVRDDPTRSALPDLAEAERALRAAQEEARILEESHRLVSQAALALPGELDAARAEIRRARAAREGLPPEAEAAARLGDGVREAQEALDRLEPAAARRPTDTVARLARLRDRLDLAIGDARTAQERLNGARSALPGTLAAARSALARAEESVARPGTGPDARVRLASARDDLARARRATDPVEALDVARRALRHAEDASALADYDRLPGRR